MLTSILTAEECPSLNLYLNRFAAGIFIFPGLYKLMSFKYSFKVGCPKRTEESLSQILYTSTTFLMWFMRPSSLHPAPLFKKIGDKWANLGYVNFVIKTFFVQTFFISEAFDLNAFFSFRTKVVFFDENKFIAFRKNIIKVI
jgi:hypothetical protein